MLAFGQSRRLYRTWCLIKACARIYLHVLLLYVYDPLVSRTINNKGGWGGESLIPGMDEREACCIRNMPPIRTCQRLGNNKNLRVDAIVKITARASPMYVHTHLCMWDVLIYLSRFTHRPQVHSSMQCSNVSRSHHKLLLLLLGIVQ